MNFISKKLIGITFLGLLIYLTFDFLQKKEEKFWQFKYNWDRTEILQNLGGIHIDSVRANYLELSNLSKLDSIKGKTLALRQNRKNYYFNFENAYVKENHIKFTGGFWILNEAISQGDASAKLVRLPLKQNGEIKINIITDSQLLWRGGRSFRKWLEEKNNDLNFVGEEVDVYGFPYSGRINNTTHKTLSNIDRIPNSDIYIISLGTHENQHQLPMTLASYKEIIGQLKNKNKLAEIFIINLPPSIDSKRNNYNLKLNLALSSLANIDNTHVIDFYKIVEDDFQNLLSKDQVHYQSKAYKMLVNHLKKELHEIK